VSTSSLRDRAAGTLVASAVLCGLASRGAAQPPRPVRVSVEWEAVERVSQTTATLQVVVNPPLRRGSPIHAAAFRALRDLQVDLVRFVPWLPYPRLAVAELELPRDGAAAWDFSLIDPLVSDFYDAMAGRPVVLNFSGSTLDGVGTREIEGGVVELPPYAVAVVSPGPS
jgi:hypothetical protein